jgi:hypothetical protein
VSSYVYPVLRKHFSIEHYHTHTHKEATHNHAPTQTQTTTHTTTYTHRQPHTHTHTHEHTHKYVEGSTMLYCTSITPLVGFYLCGLVTDYDIFYLPIIRKDQLPVSALSMKAIFRLYK